MRTHHSNLSILQIEKDYQYGITSLKGNLFFGGNKNNLKRKVNQSVSNHKETIARFLKK